MVIIAMKRRPMRPDSASYPLVERFKMCHHLTCAVTHHFSHSSFEVCTIIVVQMAIVYHNMWVDRKHAPRLCTVVV